MLIRVVNDKAVKVYNEEYKSILLGLEKIESVKANLSDKDMMELNRIKQDAMRIGMSALETDNAVVAGIYEDFILMFELDQIFTGAYYVPKAVVKEGDEMYLDVDVQNN